MIKVNDILNFLDEKYPMNTACDFDNVGLIIGDESAAVKRAIICLDCDVSAINAAKETGANLIITHHPVIFNAIKSLTADSVVYKAAASGISVISMHTNLDQAAGGVNDALCEKIGAKDTQIFTCNDGYNVRKCRFDGLSADELAKKLKSALGCAVKYCDNGRPVRTALVCSGACGNYIAEAIEGGFDALICGDIKHNIFIDAINAGVCAFDAGHYATENVVIEVLRDVLSEKFPETEFKTHNLKSLKSV